VCCTRRGPVIDSGPSTTLLTRLTPRLARPRSGGPQSARTDDPVSSTVLSYRAAPGPTAPIFSAPAARRNHGRRLPGGRAQHVAADPSASSTGRVRRDQHGRDNLIARPPAGAILFIWCRTSRCSTVPWVRSWFARAPQVYRPAGQARVCGRPWRGAPGCLPGHHPVGHRRDRYWVLSEYFRTMGPGWPRALSFGPAASPVAGPRQRSPLATHRRYASCDVFWAPSRCPPVLPSRH
jgi:hypothetical protein